MSKTIEEYFRSYGHMFVEGDELKLNEETIIYMLANLGEHKFALVNIRGGTCTGMSCTKQFETNKLSSVTYDELAKAINISVRKLTDVKTGEVYIGKTDDDVRMPFGTKLRGIYSGKEYALVMTYSNNNQYGSILMFPSMRPYGEMVKVCDTDDVTKDELERIIPDGLRFFTII